MVNSRKNETEILLSCGSLMRSSELIKSLCDDEHVKSREPGMHKWWRIQDESEWSLKTSLILRF